MGCMTARAYRGTLPLTMGNEIYDLVKAQLVQSIALTSGIEREIFRNQLGLLENIGSVQDKLILFATEIDRINEVQANLFEYCKSLNAENKALKERIDVLEKKPQKKGLFR